MKYLISLLVALALMMQCGCATLTANPNSAKILVSYATLKVIEKGGTPDEQQVRAAKIQKIASDAKTFLAGDKVTLGLLELAIREQLKTLNLSPADAMLADALVNAVIDELTAKVGTGVLDKDQLYQVSTVLGWVIDATAFAT